MRQQGKHIIGSNNFDPRRSLLTADPHELLEGVHSDKYKIIRLTGKNPIKPVVDFGKIIGIYKNKYTGEEFPTRFGIINVSKYGAHIVPARMDQF